MSDSSGLGISEGVGPLGGTAEEEEVGDPGGVASEDIDVLLGALPACNPIVAGGSGIREAMSALTFFVYRK